MILTDIDCLSLFSFSTCMYSTASKPTGDDRTRYSSKRDLERNEEQTADKKEARKARKLRKRKVRKLKKGFGRFRHQ